MKKGFSLIELLVGLAVIALALLTVYEVFLFTIKTTQRARSLTYAYQAAEEEREIIKNTAFTDLVNQAEGDFRGAVESLNRLPQGQGKLTIEDYDGDPKIKRIFIRVLWSEGEEEKEITLTTLRSEP